MITEEQKKAIEILNNLRYRCFEPITEEDYYTLLHFVLDSVTQQMTYIPYYPYSQPWWAHPTDINPSFTTTSESDDHDKE